MEKAPRKALVKSKHHMVTSLVCKTCGVSLQQIINAADPSQAFECEGEGISASALHKYEFSHRTATESSKTTMTVEPSAETASAP